MGVKNLAQWPTVSVEEVRGNPCNVEAYLCGSLYLKQTVTKFFQRPTRTIQGNVFLTTMTQTFFSFNIRNQFGQDCIVPFKR